MQQRSTQCRTRFAFFSKIHVMQQIPLDYLVSLNFLMRQVYKNSNTDILIFHCVSQIQTSTFVTLRNQFFTASPPKVRSYHLSVLPSPYHICHLQQHRPIACLLSSPWLCSVPKFLCLNFTIHLSHQISYLMHEALNVDK